MAKQERTILVERETKETNIEVGLNLDGSGKNTISTQVPFLDHMLQQLSHHSLIDAQISCQGDKEVDDHHLVEDTGIGLGIAIGKALGDKTSIVRYGFAYAPLDEALSRAVVDISNRPLLCLRAEWTSDRVGDFDTQLVREFFRGFVNHSETTLHLDCLNGINCHHQIESLFKAFALALRMAIRPQAGIPSTKGRL